MHKVCKQKSCGNDYCTRSTYRTEDTIGDICKVWLLGAFDALENHNLQKYEILALFKAVLDEHVEETDG